MLYPFLSGKGGIETVIAEVLSKSNDSIEYNLFLPGTIEDLEWLKRLKRDDNIKYGNNNNIIFILLRLIRFLIFTKSNTLLVMNEKILFIAWLIRLIFKKKYKIVTWFHFSLLRKNQLVLKSVVPLADAHFAISSGIIKQLRLLGISDKKIKLVLNPIERTNVLIPSSKSKRLHFAYIGRIQFKKQKNIKELIDVLSRIPFSNWYIDIIGDGEDMDKCQEYANKKDLSKHISWLGWQKNPWQELKIVDLLLLTSNYEGLPMILGEALSHGVPCLSSDCLTGPDDFIVEGKNGFLYELHNIDSAVHKIIQFKKDGVMLSDVGIQQSILPFYKSEYFIRFNNLIQDLSKTIS